MLKPRHALMIAGVVGVMVAISTFQMRMGETSYVRNWQDQTYMVDGTKPLLLQLRTTRVVNGQHKGKFGVYDELRYSLTAAPKMSDDATVTAFLQEQSQTPVEIWFADKDGKPVVAPVSIQLQHTDKDKPWSATGSAVYPPELPQARNWWVEWSKLSKESSAENAVR